MEDESGLELSLGLSCGGSSCKSKPSCVPPDSEVEEGNNSRLMGGNKSVSNVSLKTLFETGKNQEYDEKEKTDQFQHQRETFMAILGKSSAPAADISNDVHNNSSQFSKYQELWVSNNKTNDTEEEKSVLNKRKLPFEDINLQRKHENTPDYVDIHDMIPTGATAVRNSHVSATTGDGSFGENEDVADSEAQVSHSWLVSQREESSRCSDASKYSDKQVLTDPNRIGSQGQKQPTSGNKSNIELGKVAFGVPLSLQPRTMMAVPYPVPVKMPTSVSAPNGTGFPSPCVMQLMPLANGERPVVQTMNTSNSQLAFGYSTVQLPTLEANSPWSICSQPPHATSFGIRDHADGALKFEHSGNDAKIPHGSVQVPLGSSVAVTYENNSSNLVKGSGIHVGEVGTSTQTEDEGNRNNSIFRPKEVANQPVTEGFPTGGSIIRPGIASNVKFGGCGSYPDLPWVSTTGPGPNGKTISGVTYKYNKNEIKIVCACHGSHMSPDEFVQHASADTPNPENNPSIG